MKEKPAERPESPKKKSVKKKTIQLFLASSNELVDDRRDFELWIGRENKRLNEKGLFIHSAYLGGCV